MKKEIFVNVNADSVRICSPELNKVVYFADKGIRNPQPSIIALVVREILDELSIPDSNIVLVPGTEYIICSEKITGHAKKLMTQETETCNQFIRVMKPENLDFTFIRSTTYIFDGKTISSFETIPLLQKYFANRKTVSFNQIFLNQLIDDMYKNDIIVTGITTADALKNNDTKIRQIVLNIGKNSSSVSVSESGKILNTIAYEEGTDRIISDVSNNFNISLKTAATLVNKFGFAFLPQKYHNVVIDVPVYSKLMQSISMPDLTFCIRESLKDIFNNIISGLSAKVKDYYIGSALYYDTYLNINGMDKLLELLFNTNVSLISTETYNYHSLIDTYNILIKADIEDIKTLNLLKKAQEPILETAEQEQYHTPFVQRITGIFNSKIKPILLEPDFQ